MHEAPAEENTGPPRLSIKEAASALGITPGAVRSRLRRGSLQSETDNDGNLWVILEREPCENAGEPAPAAEAPPETAATRSATVERLFEMQEVYRQAYFMIQDERMKTGAAHEHSALLTAENAVLAAERDTLKQQVRELQSRIERMERERLEILNEILSHLTKPPPRQPGRRWWPRS